MSELVSRSLKTELYGALAHAENYISDVGVEINAEVGGALDDLLAVYRTRKGFVF